MTRQVRTPSRSRGRRRPARRLLIALLAATAVVLVLLFLALWALVMTVREEPQQQAGPQHDSPTRVLVVDVASPTPRGSPAPVAPAATASLVPTRSEERPAATLPPTSRAAAAETATLARPTATATRLTTTPSPLPQPTNTPQPKLTCRNAQQGLIGFKRQQRCNARTGDACGPVEIWVMNADGSNQAPMCNRAAYDQGLTRDRTSPDGTWRVEVVQNRRADIARVFSDGRVELIIVNNRQDWDPVLSADGWWLAWVTNRNANDEIYIKTLDWHDQNQRRLTVNDWEWDKHPTWSPDGRRIAFYSNRANTLSEATRQIWVMDVVDDRGVNLRNLSNRPDQVDIDPVWFKWDGIP